MVLIGPDLVLYLQTAGRIRRKHVFNKFILFRNSTLISNGF